MYALCKNKLPGCFIRISRDVNVTVINTANADKSISGFIKLKEKNFQLFFKPVE
jgi:hypothetical protein